MRRENQTFRRPRGQPEAEGWTGFSDKNVRAKFIRKVSEICFDEKEFSFLKYFMRLWNYSLKTNTYGPRPSSERHEFALFQACLCIWICWYLCCQYQCRK